MIRIPCLIFLIMTLSIQAAAQCPPTDMARPIDVTLTKSVDLTLDGIPDVIELNVKATSFKAPFTWRLSIYSKGKRIFTRTTDDAWLTQLFNDKDFVGGCNDYVSCKCQYYFHDILDRLVSNETCDTSTMSDTEPGRILYAARACLSKRYGLTGQHLESVLRAMAKRFSSGKVPTLSIPISPVQSLSPEVFVPEVDGFVVFYED